MIDWSKYPALRAAVHHRMRGMVRLDLVRLLRAERERCAEVCRRRAYQHGNPMGSAPQCVADEAFACADAIEALEDEP